MYSIHVDTARTWRGGQNQVLLTVLGLRSAGQRATLVAHPTGALRERAAEGLDLVPLAPRSEMDLSAGWRLWRILRTERPDVLHAHDPHAVAMASLALSLGRLDRRPVLVASRRVDFHLKQNAFSRWKYRQVRCFICASQFIHDLLLEDGVEAHRLVTIHEGIDIAHVDAAPRLNVHETLWLPHGAPIVTNVGALVAHKGQGVLIEAARLVVPRVPDARFVIVGEGELRDLLERRIRDHHLEKHVLLTGFRPDAVSFIKGADVFVMSSVTEGLGTSVLDAMACARPIVATGAGGIPEMIDHGRTGLLVPPRDPRAMADAVVRLLEDEALRTRLGEAARAEVVARFSAERMVGETAGLYARLVGRSRAGDSTRHVTAG